MNNQNKYYNKNKQKHKKNKPVLEKTTVKEQPPRREREYSTFSQHAKKDAEMRLNIVLDLFDLQARIEETGKGFVIDRKGNSFGTITFSKPATLKTRFTCKNGYVKSNIQVSSSVKPGFIPFEIQNKKGEYQGLILRSQTSLNKMLGVKLERVKGNTLLEKVECSYSGSYFKYQNKETSELVAFLSSYPGYGLTFVSHEKNDDIEREIIISADINNEALGKIQVKNCLTGEELDTDKYFDQIDLNAPITEQMTNAINLICPNAYQRIEKAINSYDYPGINLIKKSIQETNITEDELNMCFGKDKIKKLIK